MNAALRAKVKLVAKLLATASEDEVRTRYQIGQIISELKRAENKYGANAVERVAKPLGRPASTLYRYSLVAERWSLDRLGTVLGRRNTLGQPLSWSHFVVLASVDGSTQRKTLLERTLSESLSARQLRLLLGAPPKKSASPTASLRRVLERVEAFGDVAAAWTEAIGALEGKNDDELAELLDRAAHSHRRLLEQVQEQVRQIESVRKRFAPPDSTARPTQARTLSGRVPVLLAGG